MSLLEMPNWSNYFKLRNADLFMKILVIEKINNMEFEIF